MALKISATQAPPTPWEANQCSGTQKTPQIAPHTATAKDGRRCETCLAGTALMAHL